MPHCHIILYVLHFELRKHVIGGKSLLWHEVSSSPHIFQLATCVNNHKRNHDVNHALIEYMTP